MKSEKIKWYQIKESDIKEIVLNIRFFGLRYSIFKLKKSVPFYKSFLPIVSIIPNI
jgi:hypothetical protein